MSVACDGAPYLTQRPLSIQSYHNLSLGSDTLLALPKRSEKCWEHDGKLVQALHCDQMERYFQVDPLGIPIRRCLDGSM